jgi:hypothetical protein
MVQGVDERPKERPIPRLRRLSVKHAISDERFSSENSHTQVTHYRAYHAEKERIHSKGILVLQHNRTPDIILLDCRFGRGEILGRMF